MEALNDRFEELHCFRLALRIGVNTGEVIAPLGERVDQLIVAGDAVNVAARLEASAEPGTILVSERTFIAALGSFRFSEPLSLDLKGKAQPVKARRLLAASPGYERENHELRASPVGRELELSVLTRLLDEVVSRSEPRIAIVYGPAGIGKTQLGANRGSGSGLCCPDRPPRSLSGDRHWHYLLGIGRDPPRGLWDRAG